MATTPLHSHLAFGFINRTFGLEQTIEVWRRITGRDTSTLLPIFATNGTMGIKLDIRDCPSPPYADTEYDKWITDYIPNPPMDMPVVRQTLYVPRPNGSLAQREPHYRDLQAPIFFLRRDDPYHMHIGINLARAAQGDTNVLVGVNDPLTRFDTIQKTTLVLMWDDCPAYEDQLCLWDKRAGEGTTMGRFVKKVAGWTCRALERTGAPAHPANVWLVGMVAVCTGHWQVILQAQRPGVQVM